jgi:multicomponent Na+:H+ antiporter subunit B
VILLLMSIVAFGIIRLRNLFAVVMLSGIFSLLAASFYVHLTAVDVAFTEASVGAGISTLLMLATLAITGEYEKKHTTSDFFFPLLIVVVTGAALIYGTLDMPLYGALDAPANSHLIPRFIEQSGSEIGVPNIVTSILASYRGYDTLGETVVIFTAAIGVLVLLGRGRNRWRPGLSADKVSKDEGNEV